MCLYIWLIYINYISHSCVCVLNKIHPVKTPCKHIYIYVDRYIIWVWFILFAAGVLQLLRAWRRQPRDREQIPVQPGGEKPARPGLFLLHRDPRGLFFVFFKPALVTEKAFHFTPAVSIGSFRTTAPLSRSHTAESPPIIIWNIRPSACSRNDCGRSCPSTSCSPFWR